jgi:hypothetical protein
LVRSEHDVDLPVVTVQSLAVAVVLPQAMCRCEVGLDDEFVRIQCRASLTAFTTNAQNP